MPILYVNNWDQKHTPPFWRLRQAKLVPLNTCKCPNPKWLKHRISMPRVFGWVIEELLFNGFTWNFQKSGITRILAKYCNSKAVALLRITFYKNNYLKMFGRDGYNHKEGLFHRLKCWALFVFFKSSDMSNNTLFPP